MTRPSIMAPRLSAQNSGNISLTSQGSAAVHSHSHAHARTHSPTFAPRFIYTPKIDDLDDSLTAKHEVKYKRAPRRAEPLRSALPTIN